MIRILSVLLLTLGFSSQALAEEVQYQLDLT